MTESKTTEGLQTSDKIIVGQIISAERHPDAEKLTVCMVNVGQDELLQIVCGAKNVAAGLKVPVALHGAKLPGGKKIKRGKLRGVLSNGMICAQDELGFARDIDGIWVLDDSRQIGTPVPYKEAAQEAAAE
ncbi:YtpR family tRNA-binding protein [Desulforamulus hydrothermalis]|uniref:T-RNA-binding domain protein n=1 Tax=Desulforamulus hydrothermalis Lam5 = DSM 18033 TaxID=1121428 RepID=K8E186_9FIRM|nr:T-RNA-binding domain protein [Desulforamulus hydrothermalis]CCO09479.1 T-RNA-binding domain protein [Desulforamulus hydrothermalis Lam5 = DSM 18033]SHH07349.1 tRNA-binding EMAP/Myf domain-containing protein [Desulforamulus hydrothermalis Lam5 = DSM 18033]